MAVVGVGLVQELADENTYLETDLNTGECRNIAVKPKVSLPSTTKLQLSESSAVSGGVNTSLQGVGQSQKFRGQVGSQSLLPERSAAAAFGYPDIGNAQQVTTSELTTSDTSGVYSGIRNPPVSGAGFPSDDVRTLSSEVGRTEPSSGVYSLASSRPSVQQTSSKPGADVANWAPLRQVDDFGQSDRRDARVDRSISQMPRDTRSQDQYRSGYGGM